VKFTGTLQNFDDSMWGFHIPIPIPIPNDIADIFVKEKKNKRVICNFKNGAQVVH
jgi:small nuclear ribonucleoprotein (snRNP)-like protein